MKTYKKYEGLHDIAESALLCFREAHVEVSFWVGPIWNFLFAGTHTSLIYDPALYIFFLYMLSYKQGRS